VLAALDAARHDDPYPYYRAIRESDPLTRCVMAGQAMTAVTRHGDTVAVLQDPAFGHGNQGGISAYRPAVADGDGLASLLRADPPDHTRLRRLVTRGFSPGVVNGLVPDVTQLVHSLLDAAFEAGEVDLVEALARPMPLSVICRLLGVPAEDEGLFGDWADALVRGIDPDFLLSADELADRHRAARNFDDYFRALIARARATPGDDLVSRLASIQIEGDALTERELVELCVLLLVAGYETSVNLIGGGVLALLRNPDQLDLLRADPGLVPSAVEEMLRYEPPVQFITRTALRDTTVGERGFDRGEGVLVLVGAASRDPEVFEDPDRFLVRRYAGPAPAPRHFGFSMGIHYCLGAALARVEATITFRVLLERARELALTDEPLAYRPQIIIRGLRSLPLRLAP
jgi:cytochrome P450